MPQKTATDERSLRYADSLAKLIRFETVSTRNDPRTARFLAFHKVLRKTFPHIFAASKVEVFNGALLLHWPGSNPAAKPILFMNHMDVVEAGGTWSAHGPFSGDIADGKVWGRGTLDTKGGLWAMLTAADELAAEGFKPSCDIWFESSDSEEISDSTCGMIVAKLKERGIRFKYCLDEGGYILYDPLGGADGNFAAIGVGEKVSLSLKFTARSNGGHAATPGKDTPLVRLGRFMDEADRKAKAGTLFKVELPDVIAEMLRRMAPTVKGALGKVFAHPDAYKPVLKKVMPAVSTSACALMRTTIAFTQACGSEGDNVLPASAWVIANLRCSHHQGLDASMAAITKLAKKHDLEVEIYDRTEESPLCGYDGEGFKLLEKAIIAHYPDVIPFPYIMNQASDCRYLGQICDECLRFVPFFISDEQMGSIHGIDENVDISTLAQGVDVYKHIMRNA